MPDPASPVPVRAGVHGGGVGAGVDGAAEAGFQRATHALQQEQRHEWGVSATLGPPVWCRGVCAPPTPRSGAQKLPPPGGRFDSRSQGEAVGSGQVPSRPLGSVPCPTCLSPRAPLAAPGVPPTWSHYVSWCRDAAKLRAWHTAVALAAHRALTPQAAQFQGFPN